MRPGIRSVGRAGSELIRRRFTTAAELIGAVYAALVRVLEEREVIRFTPFDATFCRDAMLADLDFERVSRFLVLARRGRSFPLPEHTPPEDVLAHLNLLDRSRPALSAGLIEMTVPDKPTSRRQKYRLTVKGLELLKLLDARAGASE